MSCLWYQDTSCAFFLATRKLIDIPIPRMLPNREKKSFHIYNSSSYDNAASNTIFLEK